MDNLRGILLMVISMFCFAVEDLFVKQVSTAIPVSQIVVTLGFAGFVVFSVIAMRRGDNLFDRAFLSPPVIWRSIGEALGTIGFVCAIAFTPLTSASAIFQAMPLVVTLGAALFLGETVGWRRWSAIGMGFVGVLIIIRPGFDGFEPLSLFAVLASVGLGARDVTTRVVPKRVSSVLLAAWGFLVLVPTGLAMMLFTDPFVIPESRDMLKLGAAIFMGILGYYAITAAMRVGEVAAVTPFRYTRLLFALIFGMAVFGERPDIWTLIGAAIVIASGLYSLAREAQMHRRALSR